VALTWIGFELKGQFEPILVTIIALSGIYLSLFNGIWLFNEDPIKKISADNPKDASKDNSGALEKNLVSSKGVGPDSAVGIVSSQRKFYDAGIRRDNGVPVNSVDKNIHDPVEISGLGWRYDSVQRVLWNPATNETLFCSSGLGFSISADYFFIYNKVRPRKIPIRQVEEANYIE
jgi:hypothetical protein